MLTHAPVLFVLSILRPVVHLCYETILYGNLTEEGAEAEDVI